MNLDTFPATEPIFVDANIWTYFALNTEPFQTSCTIFMYGIETGRITAAISDAILNEVFYAILVGRASTELQTTKIKHIHRQLLKDKNLSAVCYQTCLGFTQYLDKLPQTNLKLLTVSYQTQVSSLQMGQLYRLLPTDALHVATCQHYQINHIATADAHFETVNSLQVWQPSKGP